MYTVLEYFTDLQDNNYIYKTGDEYPHTGYTPSPARIKELSGNTNVRKHPIIKKAEPVAEVTAEETETEEVETAEKPKKRGRKKSEE